MKRLCLITAAIVVLFTSTAKSQWSSHRPDGHAPISVMGDHTHSKGEWMLSYRYMYMNMDGNRDGTSTLTNAEVLRNFMVTPTEMPMQMHMFGVMYAPSNKLTLMAMVPFHVREMDHVTRMGGSFTTESSGVGDIQLSAIIKMLDVGNNLLLGQAQVSIPVGSLSEKDQTPASAPNEIVLPFPMQLGSGTLDLKPAVTYLGQNPIFSWGSQIRGVIRLGENTQDWALGNELHLRNWLGYNVSEWFAPSVSLNLLTRGNIRGREDRTNPVVVHTADPDLKAGTLVDAGVGVNFFVPHGALENFRIGTDLRVPFIQYLKGPQMERDWQFTVGIQYSFK